MLKKLINYFTVTELIIWFLSIFSITVVFIIFDRCNYLTLFASLIGVTSLIINAKGNPLGQLLMVIFSIIYSVISFRFRYYGEMLTYAFMTAPMSLFSLITWLKHPYNNNKSQVRIYKLKLKDIIHMLLLTLCVTLIFYHVLKYFNTKNLIPSTISVATSFAAVFLTAKRSEFFALGYAANDIVLIILWTMASLSDISYLSVTICFAVFLLNDLYCFFNWKKLRKKQEHSS